MALKEELQQINDLDQDLEKLEALAEEIRDAPPELLPEVLAMFERVGHQDDFGVFHAFGHWIEALEADEIEGKTIEEHLVESVTRRPNWKTLEVAEMLVEPETLLPALQARLEDSSLSDRDRELYEMSIENLEEALEDY